MDAIKRKMQAMKVLQILVGTFKAVCVFAEGMRLNFHCLTFHVQVEKDAAMDRCDQCEQLSKAAKVEKRIKSFSKNSYSKGITFR